MVPLLMVPPPTTTAFHMLLSPGYFQGVKGVIAESYERIHRSNLVGMGIVPMKYMEGENADSLGLTGKEQYTISIPKDIKPRHTLDVNVSRG